METRAHYALIGAFMLAAIVGAVFFVLWLGGVERETDDYEIVFRQKISGLQEGASVLFNGIRVGEVTDLRLDRNDPNRSLARVAVERDTPVKTDTRVELELVGVTGLAVVQFNGGSPEMPLLKDIADGPVPVIEADLSGIAAVLESSGDIALNIQRLVSQENAQSVGRILGDIEALTDVIADKETEISLIIDNLAIASTSLRQASERFDGTMAEVDGAVRDIRAYINEDGEAFFNDMASAAEELDLLMADIRILLDENSDAINAFTNHGLVGAVTMINRANRLVATTESILTEFERDPTRFLLGEGRPAAE